MHIELGEGEVEPSLRQLLIEAFVHTKIKSPIIRRVRPCTHHKIDTAVGQLIKSHKRTSVHFYRKTGIKAYLLDRKSVV